MSDEGGESGGVEANGPNALCFTCGGLKKISEPRLYMIQATEEMQTGMTMAEWRTCPQCNGKGYRKGIHPPA